jgi:pilus assembly protein CpaB
MRSGEPLLPGLLAGGEAPGFARRLGPGIRALTVAVDEVNSLSGMLQPGDRIDLMLSVRPQPTSGAVEPEITRTLMQNVHVLATGRQVRPVGDTTVGRSFTTITVEVDPGQAQQLVVAQRSGRLTAMLRNPDDRQKVSERMLDVNALLGLPRRPLPPAAPPPQPRTAGVQVIVGGRGAIGTDAGSAPVAVPASPVGAAAPAPLVPNQAPRDGAAFAAAPRRPDVPAGSRTRPPPAADPLTLPADAMPPGGLFPETVPVVPPSLIR